MQLSEDKILRVDVCTLSGNLLLSAADNFTFIKPEGTPPSLKVVMIKGKKLPIFPRGAKVNVVYYTKAGDRMVFGSEIDVSTEWQLNISYYINGGKVLEERRRYFKIECDLNCRILMLNREDEITQYDPHKSGTVRNINLGGVFVETTDLDTELKIDDVITLLFPNVAGNRLEIMVKILRVQFSPAGELQGYGCCFLMLTGPQEQLLAKFINQLQLEKRKSERA